MLLQSQLKLAQMKLTQSELKVQKMQAHPVMAI
jgi:hypothetical protein